MGKFNNKIEAEFNPPRKWVLSRALSYKNVDIDADSLEALGINAKSFRITCNKGMITDLASVPRMCWAFIAPWDVARAAIIHDLLYKSIRQYRADKYPHDRASGFAENKEKINAAKKAADDVFLMAMKDANPSVPKWKMYSAYWSVRMCGRWSIIPNENNI